MQYYIIISIHIQYNVHILLYICDHNFLFVFKGIYKGKYLRVSIKTKI